MGFTLVTLRVSDIEKSFHFYNGILGLPVIKQFVNMNNEKIIMLGQEEIPHIELIESAQKLEPGTAISIGFKVENAQNIIREVMNEFDCLPVGPISPNPNLRFFFIKDPDGYQVQLLENCQPNIC